jgi:hypothetical protein
VVEDVVVYLVFADVNEVRRAEVAAFVVTEDEERATLPLRKTRAGGN